MAKEHVAKWYHMLLYPDWLRRWQQKPGRFLAELVRPGMVAADVGCGLGFYAVELARRVGETGRVLAIDFQPQMLSWAQRKSRREGVSECIEFVQCEVDDLKVSEEVDFCLSMWVVHEVPDRGRLFGQIRDMLKPGGRFLLAEPKFHVKKDEFEAICAEAEAAGLRRVGEPAVGLSFAVLWGRAG